MTADQNQAKEENGMNEDEQYIQNQMIKTNEELFQIIKVMLIWNFILSVTLIAIAVVDIK